MGEISGQQPDSRVLKPLDSLAASLAVRVITVSNLQRSLNFFQSVFGFEQDESFHGHGLAMDALTQLRNVEVQARMMRDKDGVSIELVQFLSPVDDGPPDVDSVARYGITHMAFQVDDLDETCAKVVAAGGQPYEDSRVIMPLSTGNREGMFIYDPDGLRLEILSDEGASAKFWWNAVCVRDLEQSIAYYRILGFEPAEIFDLRVPSQWVSRLNNLEGISLLVQIIRDRSGNAIELVKVFSPEPVENGSPRPFNRLGLVNMAFTVSDRDAVGKALIEHGGTMFDDTRVEIDFNGTLLRQWHGMDPSGARIELVEPVG